MEFIYFLLMSLGLGIDDNLAWTLVFLAIAVVCWGGPWFLPLIFAGLGSLMASGEAWGWWLRALGSHSSLILPHLFIAYTIISYVAYLIARGAFNAYTHRGVKYPAP